MIDDKIIYLYDRYTHGTMRRRVFLKKLAGLAGSAVAASLMLPLLEGDDGSAEAADHHEKKKMPPEVLPSPDIIEFGDITYPGASGPMKAYMARTTRFGSRVPTVLVVHQNKGLSDHIRAVTREFGRQGFLAIAPDALSPLGGAPKDLSKGRDMIRQLDRETTIRDFMAGLDFARNHPASNHRIGVVGFCWGGSMVGQLAVRAPKLDAGVVYYGSPPPSEEVSKIKARLMLHYAGLDTRIGARVPAFEEALKAAGTDYQLFTYEGAHHAFNNDTQPARYNKAAAKLAWRRTVDFFHETLGGQG